VPYLILSDIHGNREALEAVLAAVHGRYDRILCLGDLVDYGADPNAVVEWARANLTAIVRGNHDKACAGLESFEHYNPAARASAAWTRSVLTPANIEYLEKLPRGPLRHENFDLVHGSPLEEDEYLITLEDAAPMRACVDTPVTFFGHTHVQGGFLLARGGVKRIVPRWTLQLEPEHFYLINPGSVGQPRDRDPRAAYALYSPRERVVEYGRVPYDVAGAAAKIRAAGLPDWLAARLRDGV
jgi:diadenosine tetraphosphatase ApaH/serine/threonine PP2A family protein phosphatase